MSSKSNLTYAYILEFGREQRHDLCGNKTTYLQIDTQNHIHQMQKTASNSVIDFPESFL